MQTFLLLPFVLVVLKRYELMVCKHIFCWVGVCVKVVVVTLSDLYVGLGIPQLLEAILKLLPLDTYVPSPVDNHKSKFVLSPLWIICSVCANLLWQAAVMDLVDGDKQKGLAVPVWDTYTHLLHQFGSQVKQRAHKLSTQHRVTLIFDSVCWFSFSQSPIEKVERFAFYERAKKAYAVVATGCVYSLPSVDV